MALAEVAPGWALARGKVPAQMMLETCWLGQIFGFLLLNILLFYSQLEREETINTSLMVMAYYNLGIALSTPVTRLDIQLL